MEIVKESKNNEGIKHKTQDFLRINNTCSFNNNTDKIDEIFLLYKSKFSNPSKTYEIIDQLSALTLDIKEKNYSEFENLAELPTISKLSSVELLVELTNFYNYDQQKILDEYMEIIKHISNWRGINGDGNCYYRAVMFSVIEKTIVSCNLLELKCWIIEMCETIDFFRAQGVRIQYPDLFNEFFTEKHEDDFLNALFVLYDIMEQSRPRFTCDNKCDHPCYEAFLKLYYYDNKFKYFDLGFIIYLRFQLFFYIRENKDKKFSKSFNISIGSLIPDNYHYNDNDFQDFDEYFKKDLLKLDTYAERASIYLTPIVLKTSIEILNYDFGPESKITLESFDSELIKSNDKIVLIYRKLHYDIGYYHNYSRKVIDDESKIQIKDLLSIFSSINSEKQYLKLLTGNNLSMYDITASQIIDTNKVESLIKKGFKFEKVCILCKETLYIIDDEFVIKALDKIEKNKESEKFCSNLQILQSSETISDYENIEFILFLNKENLLLSCICSQCVVSKFLKELICKQENFQNQKLTYSNLEYSFKFDYSIIRELYDVKFSSFQDSPDYLKQVAKNISKNNSVITIKIKDFEIISSLYNMRKDDIINTLTNLYKKTFCCDCLSRITNEKTFSLTCECVFCCDKCVLKYANLNYQSEKCSYCLNNLSDLDRVLLEYFYKLYNNCMFCNDKRNDHFENYSLNLRTVLNVSLKKKDNSYFKSSINFIQLEHALCSDCFYNNIVEINTKKCKICDIIHSEV
jgi:hypothetical protein